MALEEQQVRAQVQRILGSEQFLNAPGLERALSYLVEQVLQGRGNELKETVLALDVFNRGDGFDPRTDSTVRTQIGRLRGRLQSYYAGPGGGDPILIEIPKGTYTPVFTILGNSEAAVAVAVARPARRLLRWVALGGAVVLLTVGIWFASARYRVEQVFSVAVLPFSDFTPDHNYEFFCEGMAEEIIDTLAQDQSLRVIARTSSFQYKGKDRDIRRIGQELNVAAVMEGSVRRDGDRLRITVQLNRTRDGSHIWSESFDLQARNLLAVQKEVSESVARRVILRAVAGPRAHPVDPETYRMFLEARYLFNAVSSPEDLPRAVEEYKKVLARDDRYALAWAGLADAYTYIAIFQVGEQAPAYANAREAAQKAVALDPGLAEGHAALAGIHLAYDWDFDRAEQEARQALALSPGSSWTHHWMYHVHQVRGRLQAASEELRMSLSLDPTGSIVLADDAEFSLYRDAWDEALQKTARCLQFHPDELGCAQTRAVALFRKHDCDAARQFLQPYLEKFKSAAPIVDALEALGCGTRQGLRNALRRLEDDPSQNDPLLPATLFVLSGDWDSANKWLERCYAARSPNMIFLHLVRDLMSDDPRYLAWLKRMNLPLMSADSL